MKKASNEWETNIKTCFVLELADKKTKSGNNVEDKQMVALLRSQILALRQENDQLKEKLQVSWVLSIISIAAIIGFFWWGFFFPSVTFRVI